MNRLKFYFGIALTLLLANTAESQVTQHPTQDYVLRFAGEQHAIAPDNAAFNLGAEFTMMGWFYFEEVTPGAILMGRLHDPWNADPYTAYTLGVTNFAENNEFVFLLSDGTAGSSSFLFGGVIPVDQWIHVAATFGSGTMRIFINGVEYGSTTFSGTPDANATSLGIGGGVTENKSMAYQSGFSGFMKHVSVWNTALAESSIASYAESGLIGNETSLIAAWDLNNSLIDKGAGGHDLAFSHSDVQSQDRTQDPLFYLEEGVENPWFRVNEQEWFSILGDPSYVAQDIYAIDFDHDGLKDILIAYVDWPATDVAKFTPLHALKNNGDGSFTDVTSTVLGDIQTVLSRFAKVGDFNNDGYEDIFMVDTGTDCCGSPGTQNTLLLGNANGTLTNASTTNLPDFADANHALDIGDIDNDGDLDIVSAQQGRPLFPPESTENKPEIFINDGTGNFTLDYERLPASRDLEGGTALSQLDWDRDGWKDMAFGAGYSPLSDGSSAYYPRKAITLMKNTGSGHFAFVNGTMIDSELSSVQTPEGYEEHVDMLTADVDGDGWQDLIVSVNLGNYKGARLDLYLNDGEGNLVLREGAFDSPHFGSRDINFWFIYMKPGDFNGDGWMDLFVEGGHAGDLLFLNDGDGTFSAADFLLTPRIFSFGSAAAVADFTGDGRDDIVSLSYGKIQLLENLRDFSSSLAPLEKPLAPVLALPADNSKVASATSLSWEENTPFALSNIQVAEDDAFTNIVYERREYTGFQAELTGLDAGVNYYWRVQGKNTAGTGDWSTVQTFHTNRSPVIQPQEFTIAENSANGTEVGDVIATDDDGDALSFSLVAGNTDNAFAIEGATGKLTVQTTAALDFETTPTFELMIEVSDGYESAQVVITVALSDVDDTVLGLATALGPIRIYPNPTEGKILLEGPSKEALPERVQIFSVSGKLLLTTHPSNGEVNLSSLRQGVYIMKLMDKTGEIGTVRVMKK